LTDTSARLELHFTYLPVSSLATLDQTAIQNSWANTYQAIQNGLRTLVYSNLNQGYTDPTTEQWLAYEDPTNVIQIVKDGSFCQPMVPLPTAAVADVTASLASAAINYLWGQQWVIVVKATKRSLGFDPCDGDTLFPQDVKYCDADGVM
jgi:hypothetical protein